jgi:hypothetical protein
MTLTPPKKTVFEVVPNGNHVARLYEIIHLGTVPTTFKGEEKMTDKIRMTFELCNERKVFKEGDEPKPFSISREFTYSYGSKGHLRPFVEGMTGSKIHDDEHPDLEALLGEACLLNVVHAEKEGNTYANIQNASPLPKGMDAPELFNTTRSLDVNTMAFRDIDALPEFIQRKMKSSEEYGLRVERGESGEEADLKQVPF